MTTVSLRMDITRRETWNGKGYAFDIDYTVTNHHGSKDEELDGLCDIFFCMEYDNLPPPDACYSMKVGDRLIVAATMSISYSYDAFTGEYDVDVYYDKERTLSRRRFSQLTRKQRKAYYIPKGDRRGNVP